MTCLMIDNHKGIFSSEKLYLKVIMQTKTYNIYRLHKRSCPLVLGKLADKSRDKNMKSQAIYHWEITCIATKKPEET